MADIAERIRLRMEATPSHRIDQPIAAVKATLARHRFVPFDQDPDGYCAEDSQFWPCHTVRDIATALHVEGDDA